MGWFGIFGENAEERDKRKARRRDKAMANKVWNEHCLWPWTTAQESGLSLVATGTFFEDGRIRLDHPSAHAPLGRYSVVDHWIPRLDKQAIDKIEAEGPVVERWARIDHKPFWQELARVFERQQNDPESQETPFAAGWEAPWSTILEVAGYCGNLSPFLVCPPEQLTRYLPWAAMIHPRVGLWLESQGVCTMDHLRSLLTSVTLPMQRDTRQSFAGSPSGEPLEASFVADWCKLFLDKYDLPVETKVRLVVQTIYSFGHDKWTEHMEAVCAPHLQDVDLPLLYAVCGVNTAVPGTMQFDLLQTVTVVSRNPEWKFEVHEAMAALAANRAPMHTGMMMLCDLTPPQSRLELYALGLQALNIDKGIVHGVDMLELPALG